MIRSIIDASSDGLWGVDRTGRITFVNAVALEYFGFARAEDMIGQYAHALVHHQRADGRPYPESECPLVRAFASGEVIQMRDEIFWRADGSAVYADIRVHPITEAGQITGAVVAFSDVRKRLEIEGARDAVELERQNFRALFNLAPEMVCILSGPEHRFDFVSAAHVRTLGFDATGMTVREAQAESVEVHDLLDHVYRTGETSNLLEYLVTVADRQRYFNLT